MDLLMVENSPEACAAVGLDCRQCILGTATCVARVCSGMQEAQVRTVFFQLYPAAACSAMLSAFQLTYAESIGKVTSIAAA
jgi:hypothetical protein